jgi:hypothetical protein
MYLERSDETQLNVAILISYVSVSSMSMCHIPPLAFMLLRTRFQEILMPTNS